MPLFLGAYVFLLPVQFESNTMNLAPSDLFLALCFAIELGRIRIVRGAWSVFHAALVIIFFISTFVALNQLAKLTSYILIKDLGLLSLMGSYLCITSNCGSWSAIRSLLRIFIVAAALHALLGVVVYFSGVSVPRINYGAARVSGMLIDPNAFGGLLVAALVPNTVTLFSPRPLLGRTPAALASVMLATALMLTFSRSAWIGLAAALLVIAAFRPSLLPAYAAMGAAAAFAVMLLLGQSRAVFLARRPNTAHQRLQQIQDALPFFSQSPLFGIGLGQFDQFTKGDPTVLRRPYIIHNTTAWMMTEFGLAGAGIFLGLMLWFFTRGAAAYRSMGPDERPLIVGLLGAHAGMLGLSAGIEALYQRHWWLIMAMIGASSAIAKRTAARAGRAW
ncbi:MAG TPA: O-antigen ligase family protein [Bryobacterales bacterium]|nr:O-antigen ligase family protein [Bryobacterales bacterium]